MFGREFSVTHTDTIVEPPPYDAEANGTSPPSPADIQAAAQDTVTVASDSPEETFQTGESTGEAETGAAIPEEAKQPPLQTGDQGGGSEQPPTELPQYGGEDDDERPRFDITARPEVQAKIDRYAAAYENLDISTYLQSVDRANPEAIGESDAFLGEGDDSIALNPPGTDLVVKMSRLDVDPHSTEAQTSAKIKIAALALVDDLDHFEKPVAYSEQDSCVVTRFAPGKDLFKVTTPEITSLSDEDIDRTMASLEAAYERGVSIDDRSLENFFLDPNPEADTRITFTDPFYYDAYNMPPSLPEEKIRCLNMLAAAAVYSISEGSLPENEAAGQVKQFLYEKLKPRADALKDEPVGEDYEVELEDVYDLFMRHFISPPMRRYEAEIAAETTETHEPGAETFESTLGATISEALLKDARNFKGDGFYLFPVIDDEQVRITSYGTTLAESHTPASSDETAHRALLAQGKGIITATFDCGPEEVSDGRPVRNYEYFLAKPEEYSAYKGGWYGEDFGAMVGASWEELDRATTELTGTLPTRVKMKDILRKLDKKGIPLNRPRITATTRWQDGETKVELLDPEAEDTPEAHKRRLEALRRTFQTD